jgi:hypothetical protein
MVMALDEERIAYGVARAERGEGLSDPVVRAIASQLHEGQASAWYSLASCGYIDLDLLLPEIHHDIADERLDEDVRLWALHIGVYAVSKGDRLAVEGWSGLWPQDPPESDYEGYGSCAVCGDTMGAGSDPHTYSADEECHAGCCPACAVEVPEDLEAIVKRLNTADYGVYREPGLGDENDRDEAERDYKVGFFGHSVGLIRQPGFSYWTLCGYDDADEQQPYGSSAPEELESNEEL